jgi:hypothetical protein
MKRITVLTVGIIVTTSLVVLSVSSGAVARTHAKHSKAPTVASVTPNVGPLSGGTLVDVRGSNLVGASAVKFGSAFALFVVRSRHLLQAVAPAEATGTVDIEVTTGMGTSLPGPNDAFSYVTTPTIQSVRPAIGSSAGGNQVTISGSGFAGVTAVSFGTTAATKYFVDSPNAITAVSPAHGVGRVDVTVNTSSGKTPIGKADQFTYVMLVPVVSSVVFDVGNQAGGDVVTITGARFSSPATVNFGSTPALNVTVKSGSTIVATSPAGTGTVEVTVETSKGASVLNPPVDEYMYTATGP